MLVCAFGATSNTLSVEMKMIRAHVIEVCKGLGLVPHVMRGSDSDYSSQTLEKALIVV
jgi:hypothetical protein